MARWHEDLFPVLEELHIGYVAFSPLANGFLSAKYSRDTKFDGSADYRSVMPQFAPGGDRTEWSIAAAAVSDGGGKRGHTGPDFTGVDAL